MMDLSKEVKIRSSKVAEYVKEGRRGPYLSCGSIQELVIIMLSEPRSLSTFEKIVNIGFNVRFRMLGLLDGFDNQSIAKPGQEIVLLGQRILIDQSNQDSQNQLLFELFKNTPWLTYRAGFPELYHDLKGTYVTDTGWGCMIRVGQMAFAQIIRRHKAITDPQQMLEIINLFNDFDKTQPFSIHCISKFARREYGILPGDWYNPSQISHLLSLLNQQQLEQKLRLSFLVFNSGNLFFDQIIEVMLRGKAPRQCTCLPKNQHKEQQLICSTCNKHEVSLGLVLLARIGLDGPEEKYLSVLSEMMRISSFSGVIGGRPGKALYLIGVHADGSYIYLDPHYVQEAQLKVEDIRESYSCLSFRACRPKSIDPSFGICYYLKDLEEVNNFYRDLLSCRKKYQNDFFIWMNETTPHYLSKSIRLSKAIELEDDEYHPL